MKITIDSTGGCLILFTFYSKIKKAGFKNSGFDHLIARRRELKPEFFFHIGMRIWQSYAF